LKFLSGNLFLDWKRCCYVRS